MTIAEQKFYLKLIQRMKWLKGAPAFTAPVDPVKLDISNYFDVIKRAMDLGTIEKKLRSWPTYERVEGTDADVHLILQNSLKFNGPSHVITKSAKEILQFYIKHKGNTPSARLHDGNEASIGNGTKNKELEDSKGFERTVKLPTTAAGPSNQKPDFRTTKAVVPSIREPKQHLPNQPSHQSKRPRQLRQHPRPSTN